MTLPQMVVALGDRRYRVERAWGKLPKGIKLGQMSKLAVDSTGDVYVSQRIEPPVVVFDRSGKYARSWGEGMIADAHGIFVTADGRVLVVDRGGHQVLAFDRRGKLLFTLGERDRPRFQAPFNHPTDVAEAPNGDLYVADGYANSRVHRFSADGKLKRSWGRPGHRPGEFTTPHGIWVLKDGRVVVGDRENNRLQVFDPEGEYLTEWTHFYKPMDFFADGDGLIYVADQIPRLTLITDQGEIIGRCMAAPKEGHGVRGDREGNLFVAETVYDYVVRFARIDGGA